MRRLTAILCIALVLLAGLPGGVVAQEGDTPAPTATPTPTAGEGANAGAEGGGQTGENTSADSSSDTIPARLYVEQPRHVNQAVEQSSSGGIPVYAVRGEAFELAPETFNDSAVVRFGVREDTATLTYDKAIGRWVLNPQGQTGTYRVFWVVREGDTTRTYAATINVITAQYEHVNPEQYASLQEEARKWSDVRGQFESADLLPSDAGYDRAQAVIEDAITWYKFYENPLQALKGDFTAIAILIVTSPAGWILLAITLALFFVTNRRAVKEARTKSRQFADLADIDESERRAWERDVKRMLGKQTGEDLGATTSEWQAIREHFDIQNPRQFLERLREWGDERRWLGTILGGYEQLGYRIAVDRAGDDVLNAELTDDLPRGERVPAVHADLKRAITPVDGPAVTDGGWGQSTTADREFVRPTEAAGDVLAALDWREVDAGILWDERVDASQLDLPIRNEAGADGDLVDQYDVPIGEDGAEYHILERREDFADVLVTLLENIAASDYTDDEGRPRPEVDMVEFLYTFASTGAEKYRLSLWDVRDVLLRTRQVLDPDERMGTLAEDSEGGRL